MNKIKVFLLILLVGLLASCAPEGYVPPQPQYNKTITCYGGSGEQRFHTSQGSFNWVSGWIKVETNERVYYALNGYCIEEK